jgi:hypothetical protein
VAAYARTILVANPEAGSAASNDVLRAERNRILTVSQEVMRGRYDRLLNGLGRRARRNNIYDTD